MLITIDSGLFKTYQGKDRPAWDQVYREKRKQLVAGLAKLSPDGLSAVDARAVSLMHESLDSFMPEDASRSVFSSQPSGHCQDAARKDLDPAQLHDAIYACFDELGNNLQFEGARLTRVGAFDLLSRLEDPQRRKTLFLAFLPLWEALNGHNEPDSPYRRRIRIAAADAAKHDSQIAAAARTIGVETADVERWLEQILDTWRKVTGDQPVEPWNYRYVAGTANRLLDSAIPRASLLPINERYYHDLGADLQQLGILYDLDPRPGKAPLAYTAPVTIGRVVNGVWRPAVVRVSANDAGGGLSLLNELVHENGHAIHFAAVHNRPAFTGIGDDLFVEAFADVTSWDTYDPAWQQKYLGSSAPEPISLRSLYSDVMLDVAWALFEIRMLQKPEADPNVVWTEITSRYLHIVPHPEWAWWGQRVQLVDTPGYMVNYGLGAVVTADIRQHIRETLGPLHTGNPRWYPWISNHLLRFGSEHKTVDLLHDFLGRPVSPQALLGEIRRLTPPANPPTLSSRTHRTPRDQSAASP